MWIDNNITYPIEDGVYMTLVDVDEFGNLAEYPGKFEGDWCHYESCRQFIRYWWASDEQYRKVLAKFYADNVEL